MYVVTVAQMRALEQSAVDAGASWPGLMEQAGFGVAHEALLHLSDLPHRQVVVLVGPGNNGGDGLVVARHLHDAGVQVALYLWRRNQDDLNLQRCRERNISMQRAEVDTQLAALRHLMSGAGLLVDALLGIGLSRPVSDDLAVIMRCVNARDLSAGSLVLAVDVPSGIDADTGAVGGEAIRADLTVATGAIKRGVLLYPARALAGELRLAEIGITPKQLEGFMSEQINADSVRRLLPARPADSHKGTYGKAMVVAGSVYYPGAATLATSAALRVGAGLVTLATGRSGLAAPGRAPEVTLRPLPDEVMGILGEDAANELL
ncbi:MAG: NAD(P)H-hydrate epimerase, partial [Roseiflexaceae bacterium]|nr:NAD(P)H-hydrate epimerase [Roseiflexaceae bacterium]